MGGAPRPVRTNASHAPLASPGTSVVAFDWNATTSPFPEIDGRALSRSPCAPDDETLTRRTLPRARSRTNTSHLRFVSP